MKRIKQKSIYKYNKTKVSEKVYYTLKQNNTNWDLKQLIQLNIFDT